MSNSAGVGGLTVSHTSVWPMLKKGVYRLEDEVAGSIRVGEIFKIPVRIVGATCCSSICAATANDIQRAL